MANWYGTARTNYVKIDDVDALFKSIEIFDIEVHAKPGNPDYMAFFGSNESGGWPSLGYALDENGDPDYDNEVEFDFNTHVVPFMADEEVLVVQEVGAEKLRYITGWSAAYCKGKKPVYMDLDEIYKKAAKKFGVHINFISVAQY